MKIADTENSLLLHRNKLLRQITRRQFLKYGVLGAGLTCLVLNHPQEVQANEAKFSFSDIEQALWHNALSFVGSTPEEATLVSNLLMNSNNYDASLICGPLSLAPLLGLSRNGTKLAFTGPSLAPGAGQADMWLADYDGVDGYPQLFDMAFDPRWFEHTQLTESIARIDFNKEKLLPGDFMYLTGGSYTHFITVSRMDEQGRSYCVTNTPQADGQFTIDEKMLWDPQTQSGFMRDFSNGIGPEGAYTGRTGFHRWRARIPLNELCSLQTFSTRNSVLRNLLLNFFRRIDGVWNAMIVDLETNKSLFEWRSRMRYHPASTIKVPIALMALQVIDQVWAAEIKNKGFIKVIEDSGVDGRSFRQLFEAMLIHSEEDAADTLTRYVNTIQSIDEMFTEFGLQFTLSKPRRSSQSDLYSCWRSLFRAELLPEAENNFMLDCLSAYTENDDTRLGVIPNILSGAKIWNKRGTVVQGPYTMQDCGILQVPVDGTLRSFYIGIAGTRPDNITSYDDIYITERIEEFSRLTAFYLRHYL